MKNAKIVVGLVTAVLLTAGCGSSDAEDSAAQKALPVAVDGPQKDVVPQREAGERLKITPLPPMDAPFVEKVEHNLRQAVLRSARVPGETSAKCPDGVDEKAGAVSQCIATYEGVDVPYEVKISESAKEGNSLIFFDTTPKKGLLVAKAVYDSLNESYGSESGRTDASKLACEEIPAAKAVPLGKDTGYTCQYWSKFADEGEPGYATLRLTMGAQGYGLGFQPVE
ncbi:hypothetical protein OHA98_21840 [Streptomyces sp. NBC_00654]|uniref:hypothetical protein n=1 Tax=Streptomyces sp. NBC_00654 TaxID=2975799 RepID=UPI00224E1823|nr:hypothetical protein [Streptomyces sp. NBC_00654]MCX4967358.1 hypothetical protein [Streptomyces sp. NBC_00654]